MTEEGYLHISGRIKRIMWRISGDGVTFRAYPLKIENVISSHPQVKMCSVVGKSDECTEIHFKEKTL